MTGKLITYENSNMSLSCRGVIELKDGLVSSVRFKGMPREHHDGWTYFYKTVKVGDTPTKKEIDEVLSYGGAFNIISVFESTDTTKAE